jgi:hypothetical protein
MANGLLLLRAQLMTAGDLNVYLIIASSIMGRKIYFPEFVHKGTVCHFWTYTSNLTTVVKSVLKFMINGTTSILKS